MAAPSEALAIAIQHHQAGRLAAAERIYRQIVAADPAHADAWHLLGVIAHQAGRQQAAVEHIRRAIGLQEDAAAFHSDLGEAYRAWHKFPEAAAAFRRALQLKPDWAELHYNLANVHKAQGQLAEAVAGYRRALELRPDYAQALNNLGNALNSLGQAAAAIACLEQAVRLQPDFAEAHHNLGLALEAAGGVEQAAVCFQRAAALKPELAEARRGLGGLAMVAGGAAAADAQTQLQAGNRLLDQGRFDQAAVCYRRALEIDPNMAEAHVNLGNAYQHRELLEPAIACYRRALQLKPDMAEAHNNLGNALQAMGIVDEAEACYRRAIQLQPAYYGAHCNLGNALKDQGDLPAALACYRRALELHADFPEAHRNLLYAMCFCPEYDARAIYQEHQRWDRQFARPLAPLHPAHGNDHQPDRRLRIGYVSPNFCTHVVGRNLLPLLREHDHRQFEIFCYADVLRRDAFTARFQSYADAWRDTLGLSDAQLAQCVAADGIDILVDLTLHMAGSRLLAFARKPAPVQVTFAGYPGTTGLGAMDYRLTDPHLDPPGLDDPYYAEESVRLADSFWCYDPLDDQPAVNGLPAAESGAISFGCLNNFCKVNAAVLKLWAEILRAVDRSRLTVLAEQGPHRQRTLDVLAAEGIAAQRVTFVPNQPRQQYLRQYHELDIGLDTVPYNGHTTSLDSLWMGVPVVTLTGSTVVGRAGACQLMNLGLPELIASSPEQYVRLAVELAHDLARLGQLRATLRARMRASPLMDAPRFARNIETAYRQMWRRWCDK